MSDRTGCQNTQVLFWLTEILWDYTFLSDVKGCRKTQVSNCTGCTVVYFLCTSEIWSIKDGWEWPIRCISEDGWEWPIR